jgi:transposase-like protein
MSGTLTDVRLSETRDTAAAREVCQDGRRNCAGPGYDRRVRQLPKSDSDRTRGEAVHHRTNRCPNNRIEQDHRGIKGRYRRFKSESPAARFCRGWDELRNFIRPVQTASTCSRQSPAIAHPIPLPHRAFRRPHDVSALSCRSKPHRSMDTRWRQA